MYGLAALIQSVVELPDSKKPKAASASLMSTWVRWITLIVGSMDQSAESFSKLSSRKTSQARAGTIGWKLAARERIISSFASVQPRSVALKMIYVRRLSIAFRDASAVFARRRVAVQNISLLPN
jgi:hypothetical protein